MGLSVTQCGELSLWEVVILRSCPRRVLIVTVGTVVLVESCPSGSFPCTVGMVGLVVSCPTLLEKKCNLEHFLSRI